MKGSEGLKTGFVLTLILCAVLVRWLLSWQVAGSERPEAEEPVDLRPRLTTLQTPEPTFAPEPELPGDEIFPQIREPIRFTQEDAQGILIGGRCSYRTDVSEALQTSWLGPGRTVLIVHTHGTEAYTPCPGWEYSGSETLRSEDPDYSVVRVGRALTQALEAQGITVIHDETMHDRLSFSGAYGASAQAVQKLLEAHPDVGMILDLHRDAALNPDGSEFAATLRSGGTEYARLMLVVGTDQGGLYHPDWRMNLGCAAQLQALLNRSLPGLCRDLDLRTERFNQNLSPGSILIEVGAAGNTLPQAIASMQPLAEAIAALLTQPDD
ncbi:MAG: stage II sporulation protein P [Oscillospiraceae bacterium]|nr:stage II sporulation protein P [Oscillospiraceae bacterium]